MAPRGRRSAGVKDVAAAAGVSLGTVSNVLNRPDRVRPETRERVERAIAELGFVRNESARLLRNGTSHTIAYVMLDAGNPFFTDVAQGIEEAAERADLSLISCNSNNHASREVTYLTRLEQQRVQGVLITPINPQHPLLDDLPRRGTPVVIVDRVGDSDTHCSVAVDDVLGGELAARHLLDLGHERIAFVGGPSSIGQVRDRRHGAWRAARGSRHPPRPARRAVHACVERRRGPRGRRTARRASLGAAPDGGDVRQRPAGPRRAPAVHRPGLAVPRDLAIVGYDDIEFASAAAVPLTSVRQPRRELGRWPPSC